MGKFKKICMMVTIMVCMVGTSQQELQAATIESEGVLLDATASISDEDIENMKYALTGVGVLGIMALVTEILENNKKNKKDLSHV